MPLKVLLQQALTIFPASPHFSSTEQRHLVFAINNERHYPPHPPPNKFLNFSSTEQHHLVFAINNERHYPPNPSKSNFLITEDEWIWPKHWQERVENEVRPLFSSCVQNTNIISCGRREIKRTFHPKESRNAFRVAGVGENRH